MLVMTRVNQWRHLTPPCQDGQSQRPQWHQSWRRALLLVKRRSRACRTTSWRCHNTSIGFVSHDDCGESPGTPPQFHSS